MLFPFAQLSDKPEISMSTDKEQIHSFTQRHAQKYVHQIL